FRTGPDRHVRKMLLSEYRVDGVVSLPPGAFAPCTTIPSSLVVFRRDPPAPEVRFVLVAASAWPRTPPVGREDEFVRSQPDGAGFGYGDYGTATPEGDGFGDGGSLAPVEAPSALWEISAIIHKRRSQPSQNENTGGLEVWDVTTKTLASRDFELIAKRTG